VVIRGVSIKTIGMQGFTIACTQVGEEDQHLKEYPTAGEITPTRQAGSSSSSAAFGL
jgi:hypothetical protein